MRLSIRLMLSVMMFTMLTACDALPALSSASSTNDNEQPLAQAGLTPQETVENFLEAWQTEAFDTMHGLLHPRSVEVYDLDEFREQYDDTHDDIGFNSIRYTINEVQVQGTSASVDYDVTLETETFGEIEDIGRTMRLVQDNGRWSVAWSPMDIINGMTANVRLDPNRQFAPRGNIYDTNGQLLVNQTGTTYGLIMVLSQMNDEEACTSLLSRITLRPISYFESLYVDYRAADSAFFVGEIDGETYNRYRADLEQLCRTDLEVEFIGSKVQARTGRTYFGHGAAAHITGYIGSVPLEGALNVDYWRERGYSDRDLVGLSGVEFTYQDVLAGVPSQSLRLIDSSGVILRELGSTTGSESTSVTLTIDRQLQWDTAQAFIDAWNFAGNNWATRATGGAAVVMDVNNGAILSMFSFPTYDPRIFLPESAYYSTNTTNAAAPAQISNAFSNGRFLPVGPAITNRAYSEQYAPGSVFKVMSALAAADAGIWDEERIFSCELTWDGSQYGDTGGIREDWRVVSERDPAGDITMTTALTTSCNPFFWEVGALMYQQRSNLLADYLTGWGFGQRTRIIGLDNIAVNAEARGVIPQPNNITTAINDVIGQGDTQVTAIQMVRLVAAVANGGTLYQPYIVEQVGGTDGDPLIERIEPTIFDELGVSEMALRVVREGMCDVPVDDEFGTSISSFAQNRTPPSYTSCGKTGTAQTAGAPNSWYVAFAPADNPQIAVVVVVPNSREGSEVSTPIARRILDNYFDGAVADYPGWWQEDYVPVELPSGIDRSS
ncbi:MAG: penicillin-binding transpeptidase domain-containing protein [Anaerolineae bacterium]